MRGPARKICVSADKIRRTASLFQRPVKARRIHISLDKAVNGLNGHLAKNGIQFRLEEPFDPSVPSEYNTDAFEKLFSPAALEQFQKLFAIRNDEFSFVTRSERNPRARSLQDDSYKRRS